MKTTLVLDDDLYRQAKIAASEQGVTVSSVVEEGLRLLLQVKVAKSPPRRDMPSWSMGRPRVDLSDSRAVREALDSTEDLNALR